MTRQVKVNIEHAKDEIVRKAVFEQMRSAELSKKIFEFFDDPIYYALLEDMAENLTRNLFLIGLPDEIEFYLLEYCKEEFSEALAQMFSRYEGKRLSYGSYWKPKTEGGFQIPGGVIELNEASKTDPQVKHFLFYFSMYCLDKISSADLEMWFNIPRRHLVATYLGVLMETKRFLEEQKREAQRENERNAMMIYSIVTT